MAMNNMMQGVSEQDPSWAEAYRIVKTGLQIPSHVHGLFKSGWNGGLDSKQFMKTLSFSRLNPACLLDAAEFDVENKPTDAAAIEHAITYLGIRLSAVVLAVNLTSRLILKAKPPAGWKRLLQDMMTSVEIGYKFGVRASDIRAEGGALIGFSRYAGFGLLMAVKPQAYKKYQQAQKAKGQSAAQQEIEIFGCGVYQIAALSLQQLGFGTEIALGTALGDGKIDPSYLYVGHDVLRWKSAYLWVEALREGRNYPADTEMRNFFPELAPGNTSERNMALEVLYTEISKIRQNGSQWTWHLPRPGSEVNK